MNHFHALRRLFSQINELAAATQCRFDVVESKAWEDGFLSAFLSGRRAIIDAFDAVVEIGVTLEEIEMICRGGYEGTLYADTGDTEVYGYVNHAISLISVITECILPISSEGANIRVDDILTTCEELRVAVTGIEHILPKPDPLMAEQRQSFRPDLSESEGVTSSYDSSVIRLADA